MKGVTTTEGLVSLIILVYIIWLAGATQETRQPPSPLARIFKVNQNGNIQGKVKRRRIAIPKMEPLPTQLYTPNPSREGRFLSLFTVVKFGNDWCLTATGDNGTCVTAVECAANRGVAAGPCAKNFGVCCLYQATCGQSTRSNCTYFVNPGHPSPFDGTGSCQLTVHKAHPDVCQYRLDFENFNIAGPEPTNNFCNNDQFIVSGGNPVPGICGVNTGNHMYVDAGSGLNNPITLTVVTSGPSFPRNWKIRVCQIPCSSTYRAEEGCLQYFMGISGQIKTYNYEPVSGLQISNHDYSACIRTERNFCGIQYAACPDTANNRSHAFTISGNTVGQAPVNSVIGGVGPGTCTGDYIVIPCFANVGRVPGQGQTCVDRVCGGTFNAEVSTTESAVISTAKPFRIHVHTDNVEAPNDAGNRGFCLNYVQQPCTSNLNV